VDNGVTFEIDGMIAKCGGEACDWLHDDEFIADVLSSGVDFGSYESLYKRFEAMGMAWIADTAFELGVAGVPATHANFMEVARRLKYEEDFTYQPADWIPYDQRLVPDLGFAPTEEQIAEHTLDKVAEVQQALYHVASAVDLTSEGISFEQLNELQKLMQLLERFVM